MNGTIIFGLGTSLTFGFARWYFPAIPKPAAIAGLTLGLSMIVGSYIPGFLSVYGFAFVILVVFCATLLELNSGYRRLATAKLATDTAMPAAIPVAASTAQYTPRDIEQRAREIDDLIEMIDTVLPDYENDGLSWASLEGWKPGPHDNGAYSLHLHYQSIAERFHELQEKIATITDRYPAFEDIERIMQMPDVRSAAGSISVKKLMYAGDLSESAWRAMMSDGNHLAFRGKVKQFLQWIIEIRPALVALRRSDISRKFS